MKLFAVLSSIFLVTLAQTIDDDGARVITKEFFIDDYVIYRGKNDITKIVVPINEINVQHGTNIDDFSFFVFFIEEGTGLFVYKDNNTTLVLENGKDIGSSMLDGSKDVYFAATDGIYTFNAEKKTAEKYGTLTDNIRNILIANGTHEMYILTEENILYQVTEDGTKKEEISNVKNAQQVILDAFNNLFFVDNTKNVYVKSYEEGKIKEVKGLPARTGFLEFLRAPPLFGGGLPLVIDNKVYRVYADGRSEFALLKLADKPTAFAAEIALIFYIAYDKKIYQYKLTDINTLKARHNHKNVHTILEIKTPNVKQSAKN